MIIDVAKFISAERAHWNELERYLSHLEKEPTAIADIEKLKRFHYLYERASADLAKISTFSSERRLIQYLESLVARAYGEIHETRDKADILSPIKLFLNEFPMVFRRHIMAFRLSMVIMFLGVMLGGIAVVFDQDAKEVLMPFPHLLQEPEERVRKEEMATKDHLVGHQATFSSTLMTHNTRVSMLTMALGITWGIGTLLILFSNGVMLGAVALDYVSSAQTKFLLGWLLPHGVIEIPAILIAGQMGLILGGAVIGWGNSISLNTRLRKVSRDLIILSLGVVIMLIWAGIIEAFFSQYHEPVISYETKIGFGFLELIVLIYFLTFPGRNENSVK